MSSFYILVKLNILHLYNYFDSPTKLFSDPNLAKFLNISAKPFFPRIHMFINYPFCSIKICIFFFMNKVKLHPGLQNSQSVRIKNIRMHRERFTGIITHDESSSHNVS